MTQGDRFLIGDVPGFAPQIGWLVSMMKKVNNYFKWFHVVGHEINHRGQIRWLRSRATKRA